MGRIELDNDQKAAVARMVNEPTRAALNASQYGTGKTVVTIEVAAGIGANVVLIVAPLFTKYGWENTILRQYPESRVRQINSRKAGKEALADLEAGVDGWYIIGREYFRASAISARISAVSEKIDMLAYDECAAWANRKSLGFRQMKKMRPKYRMALSATPAANKFDGFFAITQWLWPKFEGHASYWKFVQEHCEYEEDFFAGTVIKGEKTPVGHFVESLPCYVRLEKDFGEPIEEVIEIDLSARERKIYDQMEKTLIAWLEDNPLIVKFPHTKRIRLRQMSLGEVSINPEDDTVFFGPDMKSTKYDTLLAYINEHPGEPMLILTDSAKYASVVAWKLIQDGHKALHWTGDVPEDIRHAMKEAFVNDAGLDFIVATIPAIGEGVDGLQHRARTMVWLSKSDNNMLNMQAFRRLYRRGQEKQVISIDIVARNTYDSGQLSNLIEQTLRMNRSLKKGE